MYLDIKKKAAYYPSILLTQIQTPFGAIETNCPDLYDKPIESKYICKIDALHSITDLFGEPILSKRLIAYKLFSGSLDDFEFRKVIKSFYRKYPSFANHVDSCVLMGNSHKNPVTNIIEPIRKIVDDTIADCISKGITGGGKFLMLTHDYVYFSFSYKPDDIFDKFELIT